jgi:hypothetical protein
VLFRSIGKTQLAVIVSLVFQRASTDLSTVFVDD